MNVRVPAKGTCKASVFVHPILVDGDDFRRRGNGDFSEMAGFDRNTHKLAPGKPLDAPWSSPAEPKKNDADKNPGAEKPVARGRATSPVTLGLFDRWPGFDILGVVKNSLSVQLITAETTGFYRKGNNGRS